MLIDEFYNPREDDILLWNVTNNPRAKEGKNSAMALWKQIHQNKFGNVVQEVRFYRKHIPNVLELVFLLTDGIAAANKANERFLNDSEDKKYRRWTDQEDKLLIDLVCAGDKSILEISTTLGRSVPAIKTRLSNLVGVKRISQKVAGKFIGTINGEETETSIDGIVYKEA